MTKRESTIEKIKALLSKTVENGCTEAEMMAALTRAQALQDTYVITAEELQLAKDEEAVLGDSPSDPNDPHNIRWQIGWVVSKFCGCKAWAERLTKRRHIRFCGAPADVELAVWMLEHLTDFVSDQLVRHVMTSIAPRKERRRVIREFIIGCIDRIGERVSDLSKQSEAARTSNARELVVIKSAAIDMKLKELGLHFRGGGSCGGVNEDSAAFTAGRAAGNAATFGRPVSAGGMLRIGKGSY
jgi:Protein of unknown function (DUF2786)